MCDSSMERHVTTRATADSREPEGKVRRPGSSERESDFDLPIELRRQHIAAELASHGFRRVSELADGYAVSEVTIRADLSALVGRGLARRVRGGAVPSDDGMGGVERTFEQQLGDHADEKRAIARAAAGLVRPGQMVALDVGTTTTAVAQELATDASLSEVTVFTNGLTVAMELERAIPRLSVILSGGSLRPQQHSLVEPLAGVLLDRMHLDLAILGCTGVAADAGITNVNLPEAEMKRRIADAAGRLVVVADGSKLGAVSMAPVWRLDQVDLLLTGTSADPRAVEACREAGLDVEVVT